MTQWKPGDRVRYGVDPLTVVGPSPADPDFIVCAFGGGRYEGYHRDALRPWPDPDEVVEVVVPMTRRQRDQIVDGHWVFDTVRYIEDICRAHKEARGANDG